MKLDDKRISQAHRIALSGKADGRANMFVKTDFLCDLITDYRTLETALSLACGHIAKLSYHNSQTFRGDDMEYTWVEMAQKEREVALTRKAQREG